MSMTSLERRNPPPRRRSCAACTKAKRRCDFAIPACLRCARRKIACQYPLHALATSASALASMPAADALMPDFSLGLSPSLATSASPLEPFDFSTMDMFQLPDDPSLDMFLADVRVIDDKLPSQDLANNDPPLFYEADSHQLVLVDRVMPVLCTSTDRREPLKPMMEEKLSYTLDEIRKAPQMMAWEVRTPWSHTFLYKENMPKIMRGRFLRSPLRLAILGDISSVESLQWY